LGEGYLVKCSGLQEKKNVAAIKTQVTNGKNSMPAFGDKLGPDDIDDVANWVYNQADKWD